MKVGTGPRRPYEPQGIRNHSSPMCLERGQANASGRDRTSHESPHDKRNIELHLKVSLSPGTPTPADLTTHLNVMSMSFAGSPSAGQARAHWPALQPKATRNLIAGTLGEHLNITSDCHPAPNDPNNNLMKRALISSIS